MVIQATIQQAIIDMIDTLKTLDDSEEAKTKNAELLSKIIVDAILSADVAIGIPVATTGSAVAQTGATTALGSLI